MGYQSPREGGSRDGLLCFSCRQWQVMLSSWEPPRSSHPCPAEDSQAAAKFSLQCLLRNHLASWPLAQQSCAEKRQESCLLTGGASFLSTVGSPGGRKGSRPSSGGMRQVFHHLLPLSTQVFPLSGFLCLAGGVSWTLAVPDPSPFPTRLHLTVLGKDGGQTSRQHHHALSKDGFCFAAWFKWLDQL